MEKHAPATNNVLATITMMSHASTFDLNTLFPIFQEFESNISQKYEKSRSFISIQKNGLKAHSLRQCL